MMRVRGDGGRPALSTRALVWVLFAMVGAGLLAGLLGSTSTPTPLKANPVASLSGCPGYPYFTDSSQWVLAMGDSYSSGEGLDCYDINTDVEDFNECHRSDYAYSGDVEEEWNHRFVACSGAVMDNILERGQWNERPQLEWVDSSYDTVLLTIGGNDLQFPDVLAACVAVRDLHVPGPECANQINETSDSIHGVGQVSIRRQLTATYRQILRRMDSTATLVVGLYPTIFPASGWRGQPFAGLEERLCVAGTAQVPIAIDIGFLEDDVEEMRQLQLDTNEAIRGAVADVASTGDVRIRVAETSFPNNTISCGDSGRPTPFINGLRVAHGAGATNPGDVGKFLSKASFHPNRQGQTAMGVIVGNVAEPDVPLAILVAQYDYLDSDKPAELSRRVGQSWYLELPTIGGTDTITWDEPSGLLPPGVTFDATNGRIQGRSTAVGDYPVTFTARSGDQVAQRTITLRVVSIAPCTVVWDSASGGSWFLATNWAPQRVPTASDVACISGGGLNPRIDAGESATVGTVLTEHYGGINNNGELRIVGTTMDSTLEWIDSNGQLYVGPGTNLILGSDLPEDGSTFGANISGPGTVTIPDDVTINASGLTLETNIINRGTIELQFCSGLSLAADLINEGTITGSGCILPSGDTPGRVVNRAGVISPSPGQYIDLRVPLVNDGGRIEVPTDGRVVAREGGSGGVATGPGDFGMYGGEFVDMDVAGLGFLEISATLSSSGATTLPSRTSLGGGTLSGSGSYAVPSGARVETGSGTLASTLVNRGTIDVYDCAGLYLAADLINEGTITGSGCILPSGETPGRVLNRAGGFVDSSVQVFVVVVDEGLSSVAGRLVDGAGQPVDGVCAYLFVADGAYGGAGGCSGPDGRFVIRPAKSGVFRVAFFDPSARFATSWFGGADIASATDVEVVVDGPVVSGVDATLVPAASVTGTVTDAGGDPVAEVCAYLFSPDGSYAGAGGCTDGNGRYTVPAVAAGDYRLAVVDPAGLYTTSWFGGSDLASAAAVSVTATNVTSGVDVVMAGATLISGRVTDAQGDPVAEVCAYLFNTDGSYAGAGACTDADGRYVIEPPTAGVFRVAVFDPSARYQTWWFGGSEHATASDVDLSGGGQRSGVDVTVPKLGSITGTLSGPDGGPFAGGCVYLDRLDGTYAGLGGCSDASGVYEIAGVPPGDYKAGFYGPSTPSPTNNWWAGAASEADATPITVGDAQTVTGIDATIVG